MRVRDMVASRLDSDGNQQSQAAEPAEFSLDDLHLDEVPIRLTNICAD